MVESNNTEPPWEPNGTVVWTTDFGLENGFVGTMRGVVMARAPEARHVDLTHAIPPQAIEVAALELRHALPYFSAGCLHVVVVDPGVGTERGVLCGVAHGQCVLGPDNGLLPMAMPSHTSWFGMDPMRFALPQVSATFHGRDVFAPLAAALVRGEQRLESSAAVDPVRAIPSAPLRSAGAPWPAKALAVPILMVDRFGNLITGWECSEQGTLPEGAWIEAAGQRIPVAKTYAEAAPGDCMALLNSWGHLEIAVRDGNASQRLQLKRGDSVVLHPMS